MINVPEWLIVGEPELKWCEAIINQAPIVVDIESMDEQGKPCIVHSYTRPRLKELLMRHTNMAEIRVERALNLLYHAGRI